MHGREDRITSELRKRCIHQIADLWSPDCYRVGSRKHRRPKPGRLRPRTDRPSKPLDRSRVRQGTTCPCSSSRAWVVEPTAAASKHRLIRETKAHHLGTLARGNPEQIGDLSTTSTPRSGSGPGKSVARSIHRPSPPRMVTPPEARRCRWLVELQRWWCRPPDPLKPLGATDMCPKTLEQLP